MKANPTRKFESDAALSADERRREPRFAAVGTVRLYSETFGGMRLEGHLLDESESGFRLLHSDPSLPRDESFLFEAAHLRGVARVVWNRILSAHHVESGFFITEQD